MMIRTALTIAALIFAAEVNAAEIKFAETPVPVNSFAEATIQLTEKESVVWLVSPEPVKMVETNNFLYFSGPAGEYKVTALVQSIEGMKVKTVKVHAKVSLGGQVPPPIPPPIPPTPSDQFTKDIQAAFALETAPERTLYAQKLAAIYKVASEKTVQDPNIKTMGQLFDTMKEASRQLLPETGIPKVRKVIGDRLNPIFGAASSPIDRAKVAAEFKAVADALNTIK